MEEFNTDDDHVENKASMDGPTSMVAMETAKPKILLPNSPNSFPLSGLNEGDKKAGQLTERKNMDWVFIENKHIFANQPHQTNEDIRREKDEMIRDFEIMVKERHNELGMKPIVFANADSAIALVGKRGCCLQFSDGSAYLDIPAEALLEYQIVYMYKYYKLPENTGPTDVQRKIYCYSAPITCGPEGTHFEKSVMLNFKHCAELDDNKGSGRLTVFRRKNEDSLWVKQEQTRRGITANRVEHFLEKFSQRLCGLEDDSMAPPRLRMCLMVVVSRLRRQYVEVILMRDDSSIINVFTDNFINARGFEQNEVHLIRDLSIDPTQHVGFEGPTGNRGNSPNDWNSRAFYSFMMQTARTGCVELRLRQPNEEAPICAISITEQGDVIGDAEMDLQVITPALNSSEGQVDGGSFSSDHFPTQVEDTAEGRQLIRLPSPDFAKPFTQQYNLQTFDGKVSPRKGEANYPTEAADENPSPVEETIAEVADRDAPTYVQSSDVRIAETICDLPREPLISQDLRATAAAPNHPGLQYGHVGTEMSDGHEDTQSPNLVTTSTTEETLSALPVRDRVARRRLISSSSLRSDDGDEELEAVARENRERPEAVSGGDNQSPTSDIESSRGSSHSPQDEGNDSGQDNEEINYTV